MNPTRGNSRFLAVICALIAVPSISAQVNGTWIGTASGNWSAAANWQGGSIPDAGGIAIFNDLSGQISGYTATIDTTRTLSEIQMNSAYGPTIASAAGQTLNMSATGLILNSQYSIVGSPQTFYLGGLNVTAQISGNGDLVKTGSGLATIANTANNFLGTVRINDGTLWMNTGVDATFGNAANVVELNGGVLGINGALTSARTFNIGANGGTFQTFTTLTLNGSLTGSGSLIKTLTSTLTVGGNGTAFTGAVLSQGGVLTFNSNGRIGGSADVDIAATLTLDNAATNLANRLNGRNVVSRGGVLNLTGNSAAATTEALGTLTLAQGNTFLTITPNALQSSTLSFSNLVRQNNATLFIRGTNLGNTPGGGVGTLVVTNFPRNTHWRRRRS